MKIASMTAVLALTLVGAVRADDGALRARYEDELYNRVVPFWEKAAKGQSPAEVVENAGERGGHEVKVLQFGR